MYKSIQQVVKREEAERVVEREEAERAARAQVVQPQCSAQPPYSAQPQCSEVAPLPLCSEEPAAEPKQSCPWYTQLGWAMFIVGSIVAAVLTGGASLIGSVAVLPCLLPSSTS